MHRPDKPLVSIIWARSQVQGKDRGAGNASSIPNKLLIKEPFQRALRCSHNLNLNYTPMILFILGLACIGIVYLLQADRVNP